MNSPFRGLVFEEMGLDDESEASALIAAVMQLDEAEVGLVHIVLSALVFVYDVSVEVFQVGQDGKTLQPHPKYAALERPAHVGVKTDLCLSSSMKEPHSSRKPKWTHYRRMEFMFHPFTYSTARRLFAWQWRMPQELPHFAGARTCLDSWT